MQRTYELILHLYPKEHRAIFAPEILDNLSQTRADYRGRGAAAIVCFWSRELGGLVSGLLSEWITKRNAGAGYLETLSVPEDAAGLPTEITEVRRRLRKILGRMEHAIANHDFPKARLYCEEERVTREQLNGLLRNTRKTAAV